jgi:hypothetical protein
MLSSRLTALYTAVVSELLIVGSLSTGIDWFLFCSTKHFLWYQKRRLRGSYSEKNNYTMEKAAHSPFVFVHMLSVKWFVLMLLILMVR